MIGAALLALERLLLPNSCVSCGRVVVPSEPDALVCAQCYARLRAVPAGCARCWQPLPPVGPCRFCADWPEAFEWVRSAVWLGDEARDIVHHPETRTTRTDTYNTAFLVQKNQLN